MGKMTLKTSVNIATLTVLTSTILFGFFTYTGKQWVENVNAAVSENRGINETQSLKIDRLETEGKMRWTDVERRLGGIETKIDRILSVAGGK